MKTALLKKIEQFAECSPKKRGRSVNTENINEKKEASKGNLCEQKRKKDGQILYYRTTKGKVNAKDQKSRQKNRRSQDREKAQSAKKTKSEMRKERIKEKMIAAAAGDQNTLKKIETSEIKTIKGVKEHQMRSLLAIREKYQELLKKNPSGKRNQKDKETIKNLEQDRDYLDKKVEAQEKDIATLQDRVRDLIKEISALSVAPKQSKPVEKTADFKVESVGDNDQSHNTNYSQKLEKTNETLRDYYISTYMNHHGLLNLKGALDHLEEQTGQSREEIKNQLLELKNNGDISLNEANNIYNLKEENIIRDFRRSYFALKINDLIEF